MRERTQIPLSHGAFSHYAEIKVVSKSALDR